MITQKRLKVTCSILCYNYGRFIKSCIESCLHQEPGDYDLEILVLDDGSTDETSSVLAEYAGNDRVVVSRSENRGFGATLGRAIMEATGEYVCLLDADDQFEPRKIATILPYLRSGNLYVDHSKVVMDDRGNVSKNHVLSAGAGCTSTVIVNRRAAETLLPVENEIYFHALKFIGPSIELKDQLTRYRIHDRSMLGSTPQPQWFRHLGELTSRLADRLDQLAKSAPFWANAAQLAKASRYFRVVAAFDFMESALQRGARFQASGLAVNYVRQSLLARRFNVGTVRNFARVLLGRPIPPR